MNGTYVEVVVVDGPNLYNSLGKVLRRSPHANLLSEYFLHWFELHRFVAATLGCSDPASLGITAFHSDKPLGSGPYRLPNNDADSFWARQGSLPNCSTWLVAIPGEQRETHAGECECGKEVKTQSTSEKGIDTTITTHLLETAERWGSACLFSTDVDFVPVVQSLRRRGKAIYSAALDENRTSALSRVSQSFLPLAVDYIKKDVACFSTLRPGGLLDELVARLEKLNFVSGHRIEVGPFPGTGGHSRSIVRVEVTHPQLSVVQNEELRALVQPLATHTGTPNEERSVVHLDAGMDLGIDIQRTARFIQGAEWWKSTSSAT